MTAVVKASLDLEAVEARLAAITPDHWVAGIDIEPDDGGYWASEHIYAVDALPVPDYSRSTGTEQDAERVSAWDDAHCRGVVAETHNYLSITDEQHDANQRLIAHAPGDLRALIAEVRRLRTGLALVAEADSWDEIRDALNGEGQL